MSFLLVSLDKSQSFKHNLRAAAASYERKYGVKPNTFLCSPQQVKRSYRVGDIHIVRKETMMGNTVGVSRMEYPQ